MRRIKFTEEEIAQLTYESVYHKHPIIRRRMQALRLKAQKMPHAKIGEMLSICPTTLRKYFDAFLNASAEEGRVEALKELNYKGKPNRLIRYQRCALVAEKALELRIQIVFLPPYSPNFNLIERPWKFVKKKALYNQHYPKYEQFHQAISNCLKQTDTTLTMSHFKTFTTKSTKGHKGEQKAKRESFLRVTSYPLWVGTLVSVLI
ncbi:MAG: transposase [Anaerolineales bacterium]|nr:transposase [Anaerolineales bacterium]